MSRFHLLAKRGATRIMAMTTRQKTGMTNRHPDFLGSPTKGQNVAQSLLVLKMVCFGLNEFVTVKPPKKVKVKFQKVR